MTESNHPLPDSYEGLLNRAQAAYRAGDLAGTIVLYRRVTDKLGRLSKQVLARRPELADMHRQARLELTGLLHGEGRFAEAIEVEQVLLETHPDEAPKWRSDLAILRISKGEVETGLVELKVLAEETPDDPARWLVLARENRIEGRLNPAQSALEHAVASADPTDAEMQARICFEEFWLYRDWGKWDEAADAWERAVGHWPEAAKSVREVYTMFTNVGRYNDARRYIDRDENALQAGFQRGLVASMTGNSTQAKKYWQEVAQQNPDEVEYGQDAWVESLLRLGTPNPALAWLQKALPQGTSVRLLILTGIAWAMHDDVELAAHFFKDAIQVLRYRRPPKQKLDSADWHLLEAVVANAETKKALKSYFAVVDTLWSA
jgi:tetratricopeptide (TPR) repeat protein